MGASFAPAAVADQHGKSKVDIGSKLSGEDLLDAKLSNGLNPVGNVRDVVLTDDGAAVQYVLFEAGYPFNVTQQDGYLPFDQRTPVADTNAYQYGFDLRFDEDSEAQAPETLKLTRAQADHRLLTRILGDPVHFAGEQTRLVEDVLIDRETGRITHFVVNRNPDSLFNEEPRAIAADRVSIDAQGDVTTSTEFAALERIE